MRHDQSLNRGAPLSTRVRLKPAAQFLVDAIVAAGAIFLAVLVRLEFHIPTYHVEMTALLLPILALVKPLVNLSLGSYRQMWMYTSEREVAALSVSTFAGVLLLLGLRLTGIVLVPFSIILLDATFYFAGVIGVRVLRRQQVRFFARRRLGPRDAAVATRTLILGAGNSAEALLRDAEQTRSGWLVVGLLDDDPAKQGRRLHGHPVLGPTTDVERVVRECEVERVVVAMPSAERGVVQDLIRRAEGAGAVVRVVPGVRDVLEGAAPITSPSAGPAPTLADLVDAEEVKRTLLTRIGADRTRRVLVTGGAGYIGNFLVRRFLDAGYHVRVLDNFTFGDSALREIYSHPNLEVREGDISSIRDVSSAVKDVEAVVALAALVGDPACGVDAEETLALNFESTKAITEACNFYGVDRLVFASSCSVYGASDDGILDETSPLNPVSLYARTRILSENVVFERSGRTTPVVLRLATVFGLSPRMRFDLVVNALTVRSVVDGRCQVFGGDQWRPFVHCSDVAEAFFLAATARKEKVAGQIFNVGSDTMNFTIGDVGRIVGEEVEGVQVETVDSSDDARNYRVTFRKIRETLGFEPAYDLRRGIREMAEAVRVTPELQGYQRASFSNVAVMRERLLPRGDGATLAPIPTITEAP